MAQTVTSSIVSGWTKRCSEEEIIVTKKGKDVARITSCQTDTAYVHEDAAEYQTKEGWVSYEAFLELVEASDQRFELIDGKIYNLASPSYKHQMAVHELHGTFYIWFKGNGNCSPLTSPFDVTLHKEEDNICVVQPDILVICDNENVNKKDKYTGIPTLVIEVISTSSRSKDMIKKLDLYKQCGVKEYWVVDPIHDQIYVYALNKQDIIDHRVYQKKSDEYVYSITFDGLKVSLQEVFI